jgi:energy-coupling factor transport system permease protein
MRSTEPRLLHPVAWWVWATCLAACALRSTNPVVNCLVIAVAGFVVAWRRPDAPWSRSFASSLRLGAFVIAIRVAFQIVFGLRVPGTTLFTIPEVSLPSWAAGVSLGGPVTAEALTSALYQGLRLAAVIACFGAATSLCSPYRTLRALPAVLHEAGVAVTVALSFAPQAVVSARRVREARRLRGRRDRGVRAWVASAMPVLEGALDRAVALAASMDGRGYGRPGTMSPVRRRTTAVLFLTGLVAVAVGAYGALDAGSPWVLRGPAVALGLAAVIAGFVLSARTTGRSRHRPDPWRAPEWATVLAGLAALGASVVTPTSALHPSVYPLEVPTVPMLAVLGLVVALVPARLAPPPPTLVGAAPLAVAA